jgi:hypothetical protein
MPTKDELSAFLTSEFPQTKCTIKELVKRGATVVHKVGHEELRIDGRCRCRFICCHTW